MKLELDGPASVVTYEIAIGTAHMHSASVVTRARDAKASGEAEAAGVARPGWLRRGVASALSRPVGGLEVRFAAGAARPAPG